MNDAENIEIDEIKLNKIMSVLAAFNNRDGFLLFVRKCVRKFKKYSKVK